MCDFNSLKRAMNLFYMTVFILSNKTDCCVANINKLRFTTLFSSSIKNQARLRVLKTSVWTEYKTGLFCSFSWFGPLNEYLIIYSFLLVISNLFLSELYWVLN